MSYNSVQKNEVVESEQPYQRHPRDSLTGQEGQPDQYYHSGGTRYPHETRIIHVSGPPGSSHDHPQYHTTNSAASEYYHPEYHNRPCEQVDDGGYLSNRHGYGHLQPPHANQESNVPPPGDRTSNGTHSMEYTREERLRSPQDSASHLTSRGHHPNENPNENTSRDTLDYSSHQDDNQDMSASSSQTTQQVDNSSGGTGAGSVHHPYGGAPPPPSHHQGGAHSPAHGGDHHHGHQQYQGSGALRQIPAAGGSHGGYYSHSGPGGYHGHVATSHPAHAEDRSRAPGAAQGHYYVREQEQTQPPQQSKSHYPSGSSTHAYPSGDPSHHRYGQHNHPQGPPPHPPAPHQSYQHHGGPPGPGREGPSSHNVAPPPQHHQSHHYQDPRGAQQHYPPNPNSPPRPGMSQSSEGHGRDEDSPPAINRKHSPDFLTKAAPPPHQAPPTVNIPQFLSGPVGSAGSGVSNGAPSGGCTCKKSRCLKLYCQCFASSGLCTPSRCKCQSCHNTAAHRPDIEEARRVILERNPMAFEDKFRSEDTATGGPGPEEERRWDEGDSYRRWHGGPPSHSGQAYGAHQGGTYSHGGHRAWEEAQYSRDRYPGSQPPSSHYHQQGQHYESHPGPLTEHRPPPQHHHHPEGPPRSMGMGPHGAPPHHGSSHLMQHPQHPHYQSNIGAPQRKRVLSHKLGCKCRRSFCLKKYCECYHHGAKCGSNCRCVNCRNKPDGAGGSGGEGDKENIPSRQPPSVSPQPGHHHSQQPGGGGMNARGGEPPSKRMRDGGSDDTNGAPQGSQSGPPRGSPVREEGYEPRSSPYHHPQPSPPHSAPQTHLRIKTELEGSSTGMQRVAHHNDLPQNLPPVRVPSIPPQSKEVVHDAPRDERYDQHVGKYEEGKERAHGEGGSNKTKTPVSSPKSKEQRSPASVVNTPQENKSDVVERKTEPRRISVEELGETKKESKEEEKNEEDHPKEGSKPPKKKECRMAIMAALAMTALGGNEDEEDSNEEGKGTPKETASNATKTSIAREVSDDARSLPSTPDTAEAAGKKRKQSLSTAEPSNKIPRNDSESSPASIRSPTADDESSSKGASHGNVVSCTSTLSSSPSVGSTYYQRGDGAGNSRDPSPLTMMPKQVRYDHMQMQHGPYGTHPQSTHVHHHYSGGRGHSYHPESGGHYDGVHHHHSYHHGPPPPRTMHEQHHGPPPPRGMGPAVVVHKVIHSHPPTPQHGRGGPVSPSSAHAAQDTMPGQVGSPMSSPSKSEGSSSHHPALPRSLSFRKICSRCGKTRSEHGELGFGNKCVYQDCGKCGAGIQMHDRAGVPMGFFCSLTVEDGATPGAAEAYEKKIQELAVRAEMKQVVPEREHAPFPPVAV